MPYRTLDRSKIATTAERLERRIGERFPQSGLRAVAGEIVSMARDLGDDAERLARPIWWLRGLIVVVVGAAMALFFFVGTFLSFGRIVTAEAFDLVAFIESVINVVIFGGIGAYTLGTLEERIKRGKALNSLHALRSVIHIIDMHQLTKDPAAVGLDIRPTASSPKRTLTQGELMRYLDYCSELLSITGKLAALYAQALNDAAVVDAVNDIETLSTNLSRKIWQKIMLIGRQAPDDATHPITAAPISSNP